MKKSHSRWGGVAKSVFCEPTLGADQKKRLPCSMGVPKMIFATPLARERLFQNHENLILVKFGRFGVVQKCVK